MTPWYLIALLVSLAGMLTIDARHRVALWHRPGRSLAVIAAGAVGFVVWDLVAIGLGFYHLGAGSALSGIEVAPHLPVEEIVFVVLLCHLTLVVHGLALRRLAPGAAR